MHLTFGMSLCGATAAVRTVPDLQRLTLYAAQRLLLHMFVKSESYSKRSTTGIVQAWTSKRLSLAVNEIG